VVVKWFTGTETDGAHLKTMHQLHEGHFDLTALEEWAQKGFDLRWLSAQDLRRSHSRPSGFDSHESEDAMSFIQKALDDLAGEPSGIVIR